MFRQPPIDPFDHSHCHHPRPRWPIDITSRFRLDLIEYLHQVWKYAMVGNMAVVVALMEQLNDLLTRSALGYEDEIDEEVATENQLTEDLRTLSDPDAFTDELRKLFEATNGIDMGGESPIGRADDEDDGDDDIFA